MCKVSVIVPVYNKEPYIRDCLDSLVNQTLSDIEILCIDDRSMDGSFGILMEYAAKDRRIHVVSLEKNQGASHARNIGIQKAAGEFLAFVDADDFVAADFLESLYAVSDGLDCVKGEIWDYDSVTGHYSLNVTYDLNGQISSTGNPAYFYYGFTSAIYRKEFIDRYGFHFPEGVSYFEDPYFTITLAAGLSSIRIVDGARYYYRMVETSLSHNLTSDKIDDFCRSISDIFVSLKHCGSPYENRLIIANQIRSMVGAFIVEGTMNGHQLHRAEQEILSFLGTRPAGNGIRVSVIVPVYNGEKYLHRTLSGLLLQTLHDIEIICVNDRSADRSLDILKEYQREDSRIRIIDCPENGGESRARNLGIRTAAGEYIAFMDQDDWVDLSFYEKLYEKAVQTHADIVKGEAVEIFYDGRASKRTMQRFEKQPLYFTGDWWTAIFRREFILQNRIELPEGYPLGGDLKFLFDACRACSGLALVQGTAYYHIMHPDSGDSERTPVAKIRSIDEIFSYILNQTEEIDLCGKDKDCYVFYYYSYLQHMYARIQRCPELEGKRLCSDFIFRHFAVCQCKHEVLHKLQLINPLLSDALENRQKDFFDQLIERDILSDIFHEKNRKRPISFPVSCTIVVPFIRQEPVEKYITSNAFLKEETGITYCFIDNRPQNRPISVVYNEFLDHYDYSEESWLILMHSDFEFLTFPSNVLSGLDPMKIYGPAGAKVYSNGKKMYTVTKGNVIEKASDNTLYHNFTYRYHDPAVDTLDCMCLIVHSSLVKDHHLRFDEDLLFDLYVEDLCIRANRTCGIPVEALCFDCAHHSSYVKEQFVSKRYLKQLDCLNRKYPDEVFGGTVTPIGGKILPSMSDSEFYSFLIRQELLTGKKL